MADDKLQIRRSTGEEKQVMHDKEQAYDKEGQELADKIEADKKQLAEMKAAYAIASGSASATPPAFAGNKTIGRIFSLQCSRDEPAPTPAPPPARHEMKAWDGVNRGSPAEEYLKTARGGLDAVHGDTWHYQQSLSVQDEAIGTGIGAALGKLLQLGGRFIGSLRNSVKPRATTPEPAPAKPASPGDGLYVERAGANFASEAKLLSHFEKHGTEFGARSSDDYLETGRGIMRDGQKVEYIYNGETRTGYAQFMGNTSRGDAKFGFVGTNANGEITTIHTQSGNSFWKLLNGTSADKTIRPAP